MRPDGVGADGVRPLGVTPPTSSPLRNMQVGEVEIRKRWMRAVGAGEDGKEEMVAYPKELEHH